MSNKQDLKEREYQPDNKTLVIIPIYNEYENIKKVIEEIRQELPGVDILIIMMAQLIIHNICYEI